MTDYLNLRIKELTAQKAKLQADFQAVHGALEFAEQTLQHALSLQKTDEALTGPKNLELFPPGTLGDCAAKR